MIYGDVAVGKTCLCIRFLNNVYTDDYIPTTVDIEDVLKNACVK